MKVTISDNMPVEYGSCKDLIEFIEEVCRNFIEEIQKGFEDLRENPLNYREKTMTSYLFPALNKSSKRSLMEVYYNNGEKNYADFYSLGKNGNTSFIIEFKHAWGDKIDKYNINKWIKVNNQLEKLVNLGKEVLNDYIDSGKSIYGMSFYLLVNFFDKNKDMKNERKKVKRALSTDFGDADWYSEWEVPTEMQEEVYSIVTMIGKVRKLDE